MSVRLQPNFVAVSRACLLPTFQTSPRGGEIPQHNHMPMPAGQLKHQYTSIRVRNDARRLVRTDRELLRRSGLKSTQLDRGSPIVGGQGRVYSCIAVEKAHAGKVRVL